MSSSILNDNCPPVSKIELQASPETVCEGKTSEGDRVSGNGSKHSSAGVGVVKDGQEGTTEVAEKSRKSRKSSAGDTQGQTESSLEGFHLDLDLELTSTSCSSSCGNSSSSEVEEIAEEKSEGAEGDREEEGMEGEEEEYSGLMSSSSDASGESPRNEEWTVTSPEPGKMRFSRLDNIMSGSEGERLSVKQITSNRIQLRNGRVLPPSTLGFFASHKDTSDASRSDTSRSDTSCSDASRSPSSLQTSPQSGRLRRSRRLAGLSEDDRKEEGEDEKEDDKMEEKEPKVEEGEKDDGQKTNTPMTFLSTSDGLLDSSGESELDLTLHFPDPDPVPGSQPDPEPSPLHYQLPEGPGTPETPAIRRGMGQGKRARGGRRKTKKGNYHYIKTNSECALKTLFSLFF